MSTANKVLVSTLARGDVVCIDLDNGFNHRIDKEPRIYIARDEEAAVYYERGVGSGLDDPSAADDDNFSLEA